MLLELLAGLAVGLGHVDGDEQAREEFEEHFWYFKNKLIPGLTLSPPGYTSVRSTLRVAKAFRDGKTWINSCETWDDVERGCFAIVGSPETVAQKLVEHAKEIGCGNLLALLQLGDMPHAKARENMRRYAGEVMELVNKEVPDAAEPMPAAIPFPDGKH